MNERKQLWLILEAVLVCVIFAALYSAGGSGDFGGLKWLRRFLAPSLFCVWAFLRSGLDWRYFIQMPLMMGSLCLPYGADDFIGKVFLRGCFGLANGAASAFVDAWHKRFIIAMLQLGIVVAVSIVSGALNPFPNAMVEQFVIGFVIVFIPAMSVGRKK